MPEIPYTVGQNVPVDSIPPMHGPPAGPGDIPGGPLTNWSEVRAKASSVRGLADILEQVSSSEQLAVNQPAKRRQSACNAVKSLDGLVTDLKRLLLLSLTIFALVALPATPMVLLTGCNTTQKQVQYKSLSAIAVTVDRALMVYADLVVADKVGAQAQAKVADLKIRYEKAFAAAIIAARTDLSAPAPQDVQALADAITTIINQIVR